MTGNGEPGFRVKLSGKIAKEIKQLARQADDLGFRAPFVAALGAIHDRLRRDPLDFGEYCFGYKSIDLWFYLGAIQPAAVRYAVQRQSSIVYVVKIILMGT